jgi:putative transcriptional regulator
MANKCDINAEILQGLREIKSGEVGRVTTISNVAAIRAKTGLSQVQFAKLLGVSARTLQDWEQARRAPTGAARTLLLITVKNPLMLLNLPERITIGALVNASVH